MVIKTALSMTGRVVARCCRHLLVCGLLALMHPAERAWAADGAVPPREAAQRRVLFLVSSGYGRPGPDVYIAAFTRAWSRLGMDTEMLHVEYLDLVRHADAEHRHQLRELLLHSYATKPPDVIVAFQDAAFDFVADELAALSPRAPLFVAAAAAGVDPSPAGGRPVVQQRAAFDYVGTIDLALRLLPNTRRVLVAGGASDIDRAQRRLIESLSPRWAGRLEFEYTTELPMAQILERVRAQPADAVVLLTPGGINRDADGRQYMRDYVIGSVAKASAVPVLRVVGAGLADYPVLGGVVFDNEGEGRRAAELVRDIAFGRQVLGAALTTLPARHVPMFNWSELQRWKIAPALLPDDAVVLGQPPSVWQQHQGVVLTTSAAFFALSALSLTMAAQSRRRRAAELRAVESEKRWKLLFENAPEAIAVYDMDLDRFVEVNPSAERLFGLDRHELLRRSPRDLYAAVQPDGLTVNESVERMQHRAEGGERVEFQRTIVDAHGREIVCAVNLLRLPAGGARQMRVSYVDISMRHEAERAREQLLAAQTASQAKTEFLSRMSHELRTPLNAVLGFAELLGDEEEALTERQRLYLGRLREGAAHLLALIDDVIDVARIEAGRMRVVAEPVALDAVLDSALAQYAAIADRAGVQLQCASPVHPDVFVRADPTRLRQVLANLISNGIKYNRAGGHVRLSARADEARVRIEIVDDGLGMTPEQLRELFVPYNRLGREVSGIAGTGIGLVLSKHLVDLMEGQLSVDSPAAGGTRACVDLPRANEARPPPDATKALPLQDNAARGRVLYIEDEPTNQLLMREALRACPGIDLLIADTGRSGIDLARDRVPDLVLLDMQLPDIDGPKVLAVMRADAKLASVPIVALSASAMPEDVERARAAGATAYWTKPFNVGQLRSDIGRLLAASESRRP